MHTDDVFLAAIENLSEIIREERNKLVGHRILRANGEPHDLLLTSFLMLQPAFHQRLSRAQQVITVPVLGLAEMVKHVRHFLDGQIPELL